MARDKRIDQLTSVLPVLSDYLAFYDRSHPGTKKMTVQQLLDLLAPVGSLETIYKTVGSGTTVNVPELVGRTVKLFLRGSGQKVIQDPAVPTTPASGEVVVDSTTGDVTAGDPFVGELLIIQVS